MDRLNIELFFNQLNYTKHQSSSLTDYLISKNKEIAHFGPIEPIHVYLVDVWYCGNRGNVCRIDSYIDTIYYDLRDTCLTMGDAIDSFNSKDLYGLSLEDDLAMLRDNKINFIGDLTKEYDLSAAAKKILNQ